MGNNPSTSGNGPQEPGTDFKLLSKHFNYRYKARKCYYRNEQFEISPEEHETIKESISTSNVHLKNYISLRNPEQKTNENEENPPSSPPGDALNSPPPDIDTLHEQLLSLSNKRPMKIIIDTDIGYSTAPSDSPPTA